MFEREKKKLIKVALGCVLVSVALGAGADTVAWWPLAYEAGVKTTVDTVITNVANPDILAAQPISLDGSVNILEGTSTYCPQGTNAFPAGWGVWVPQSNQFQTVETGLNFHKIGLHEPAGALRVDLTKTNALDLTTFTFEAFFRMQLDKSRGEWNVIAVRPGRLYMENKQKVLNYDCWGVRVTGDSKITFRFTKAAAWEVAATNNNIGAFNQGFDVATETTLYDGRWHHVALVVDGEKVWGYVDYKYKGSLPWWEGKLEPRSYTNGAENLYIGSTPQTSGCFGGTIAHVRISDAALSAQQFLQFSSLVGMTNDVPLHVNFEPAETADVMSLPGDVPNLGAGGVVTFASKDGFPHVTNDAVSATTIYDSLLADAGRANAASMVNSTNVDARTYAQFVPPRDDFTNSSFTVECFYKTTQADQFIPLVRRRSNWNVQFNLGFSDSPGKLAATVVHTDGRVDDKGNLRTSQDAITDEETTNDDAWHHGALVVDAATRTVRLYRDYCAVGTNVIVIATNRWLVPSGYPVYIGGVDNGKTFEGAIDDVRITMRALAPAEFMTKDHLSAERPTLGWTGFEGAVDGCTDFFALRSGVAEAAGEDGVVPTFVRHSRMATLRDGKGNVLRRDDKRAVSFNRGVVKFPKNPYLAGLPEWTVEFFVKAPAVQTIYSGIVRCNFYSDSADKPVWALSCSQADKGSRLRLRCSMRKADGALHDGANEDTSVVFADDRWHHIAARFRAFTDEDGVAKTRIEIFKDKNVEGLSEDELKPDWTADREGVLDYGYGKANIWLGASSSINAFFAGEIDELRISQGLLEPADFLRNTPSGMTLILR